MNLQSELLNFIFSRVPRLIFGAGKFDELPRLIGKYGKTVLIVNGKSSFRNSENWSRLLNLLQEADTEVYDYSISGEPSPDNVDAAVSKFKQKNIELVLAIGGGSVLDAGKAISAMLKQNESVIAYLEGVGSGKEHDGRKVPFVAVPTTSGTGSEATKNAVLSRVGKNGFKKSIRHENFIPDVALIDPSLMIGCPPQITAAAGLDAFTQLLESYVSDNASALTDALALDGMKYIARNLIPASTTGANNLEVRAGMAYGAFLSGITLVNAGLGVVHGLASPLGGMFEIPHGVVCGTLTSAAVKINIDVLKNASDKKSRTAIEKYARIGSMLAKENFTSVETGCRHLITVLDEWSDILKIPRLSQYGIEKEDLKKIARIAGNKNNPVKLKPHQIYDLLLSGL